MSQQPETEQTETPPGGGADAAPPPGGATEGTEDRQQTFDRAYVERLREEAGGYRIKAKRADELAHRLVTALAAGTGKLADARDLPYGEHLLDDDGVPAFDKVADAIDELIRERPHLASRRPSGDVGQGARPPEASPVSLAGLLRAGAG